MSHRVGIPTTNGADTGSVTTALHNLGLIVNNTAVSLAAPESKGTFGSYGFAAIPDDLLVTNFFVTQNIVYRNGGISQDVFDMTSGGYPSYLDPDPGVINWNLLFQNVYPASDTICGSQPLDLNSVMADPIFANPSRGDYRIDAASPALTTGFTPAGVPLGP